MMIFSVNMTFALNTRVATFSVGQFGGEDFKKLDGVIEVYHGVAFGQIHREVIQVEYNEDVITYRQLLNVFFRMIDPTDMFGSFEDRDVVYSPAIYTSDEEQNQLANFLVQKIQESEYFSEPIVVRVISDFVFIMSEDKPQQNEFHKNISARSTYIRKVWDNIPQAFLLVDNTEVRFFVTTEMRDKYKDYVKPSKQQLRDDLTEMQFAVTQLGATEPPFFGREVGNYTDEAMYSDYVMYSDEVDDTGDVATNVIFLPNGNTTSTVIVSTNGIDKGIYVDVVSGEPLFFSIDKVDLNTGWLNFKRAVAQDFIVEREEISLFHKRIEIRSRYADSHIGYIVDGYYQVNSSALRFVPYDQMEEEGYEDYKSL